MMKKTIPIIATSIESISPEKAFEDYYICDCCKTISQMFANSKFCILCNKKIEQFTFVTTFTFKPCYYLFCKIGVSKIIMEEIEDKQKQIGYLTNYLEYNYDNMTWYVYRTIDSENLYKKVSDMFNLFREIQIFNKNIFNHNIEKVKLNFFRRNKFVNIGFNFSEISCDDFQEISFFMRDKIFV